jgi:uncharacterized BrkB/YihY/UPF0761 family membrane protein
MERVIASAGQYCANGICGQTDIDRNVIGWVLAVFGTFLFIIILLVALVLAFWVWMLVDAAKRDEESYQKIGNGEKTLWIVLLIASIFFQLTLVVSLIYYFLIYQKGKSAKDK